MNILELLQKNNYELSSPELQVYKDYYDVVMPCIKKDVSMITYAGDRMRDNYDIAVFVLSRSPGYLWAFSVRLQTHPRIVELVKYALHQEEKITPLIIRAAKLAKSEGLRRQAICATL